MRLTIVLGCLSISLTVGFSYAAHISVQGWQLWTWLASVVITVVALLSGAGLPPLRLDRRWLWLAVLLLAALLLRSLLLETVPGAFHVDEHGVADFSLRHVYSSPNETINPFRTGKASQPTFYNYLVRLSMAVFGKSISGLRAWSPLAGTAGLLATAALVATLQDRRTAFITVLIMSAYHYHIHWSRLGLNNIWDTLWVPMMLAAFVWGWRNNWRGGAVLSGAAVGFSQYFYAGSRLGMILLAFVIWEISRQKARRSQLVVYTGQMALAAAVIAAPLFFFAISEPELFFERAQVVAGWQTELITRVTGQPDDYWGYFSYQLGRSAGAFTTVPDATGFYGPGVPLLIGLAAPLFIIGMIWAANKRQLLPVLWIILTVLLGGFLISDPPGSSHYVVSIPAICWLVATPISWLSANGRGRWAILLLLAVVAMDLYFYLGIYVPSPPYDLIHPFPTVP